MSEDNIAIRLKGFIDSSGLTNSQFADTCGIPRPSLSQLLSGRNKKISDVLVGQIHAAFPKLSVLWLLFGEGPMETDVNANNEGLFADENLQSENSNSPHNDANVNKYANLNRLESGQKTPSGRVNTEDCVDKKTVELLGEIEKMKKNPRKVTQITIYYDDSTFETFRPG